MLDIPTPKDVYILVGVPPEKHISTTMILVQLAYLGVKGTQKVEGWENDTGKGTQPSKGCVMKPAVTVGDWRLIPLGNYEKRCRILTSGLSERKVWELYLPRVIS